MILTMVLLRTQVEQVVLQDYKELWCLHLQSQVALRLFDPASEGTFDFKNKIHS